MEDNRKSKVELVDEIKRLRQQISSLESREGQSKEDRLKLEIMNRAPFSAWACDRNFNIVFWSSGTAKVYGYSGKEAIGENYLDLFVSEEESERSLSDCLDVIDNGIELRNFLAYDQLSDGTKRALLTNCFRVWDSDKKDYLQAEVALEIPELAQSIEEHRTLRELGIRRKAEYERILLLEGLGNITTLISSSILQNEGPQQVFDGIVKIVCSIIGRQISSGVYLHTNKHTWVAEALIDPANIFESVKSTVGEYSALSRQVLFINNKNDLPDDFPNLVDWREKISKYSVAILPLISMDQIVGVWLVAIEAPYTFEEGTREALRIIANQVAFSVSIARLMQNLKDLNVKIAEKQDLMTRSLIAVDFVHRMNNLAGPIRGWTGLIKENLNLSVERDKKIQNYLHEIDGEVEELLRAANKLEETPRPQNIDINFMLNSMLRNVKIQYSHIRVVSTLSSDIYLVSAIYSQLSDAIWNIVSNALDAMSGGGILSLESKNIIDDENKKWVEIIIRDTGVGIPEDRRNQIFSINYTTKGVGRGYGLWRSRHVVEDLGGSIALLETDSMAGTTFAMLLLASISENEVGAQ